MQMLLSLRQDVALLLCLFLVAGGTLGCTAIEEQVGPGPAVSRSPFPRTPRAEAIGWS
jgi:hypothetical protein